MFPLSLRNWRTESVKLSYSIFCHWLSQQLENFVASSYFSIPAFESEELEECQYELDIHGLNDEISGPLIYDASRNGRLAVSPNIILLHKTHLEVFLKLKSAGWRLEVVSLCLYPLSIFKSTDVMLKSSNAIIMCYELIKGSIKRTILILLYIYIMNK